MKKRVLVTTAVEETWPQEDPILFLGEWCRLYSRETIWKGREVVVEPYHWNDRKKLYTDYCYLQCVYEQLLERLSEQLNRIHDVSYSPRYWRILIGPWLGYFIQILFDRWSMLKQAIEKKSADSCYIINRPPEHFISNDMSEFIGMFCDDKWNEGVYAQLIRLCWPNSIEIKEIPFHIQPVIQNDQNNKQNGIRSAIKNIALSMLLSFSRITANDRNYFFISTYLPKKLDFNLQLALGQIPKMWRSIRPPSCEPDFTTRNWGLLPNKSSDAFLDVAGSMIPRHIPTVYLEGYQKLKELVANLPWPKHPKAVFTSNSHLSDDVFKMWAAEKTSENSSLIIGQHGGHMGMSSFAFHEEHQIEISDRWISWGWSKSGVDKIVPVGNLKLLGDRQSYDPQGGALMVEMTMPRYSCHLYSAPIAGQWLVYFEEQCRFIYSLPKHLRREILVRLYPHDYGWEQEARWRDRCPDVQVDRGYQKIHELIKKTRIYISTYNATTYLESLSWNIPTIIFWNTEHWELRDEVIPYFDLLKTVGIFHETPESAARKMTAVWDDIPSWWTRESVQIARLEFCERFSCNPERPVHELKHAFCTVTRSGNR